MRIAQGRVPTGPRHVHSVLLKGPVTQEAGAVKSVTTPAEKVLDVGSAQGIVVKPYVIHLVRANSATRISS